MRIRGNVLFLALGVATLATSARAQDETEKVVDGFSDDGRTLHAGPLHERSRLEELRARLVEDHRRAPEDDALTIRLAVVESRIGRHERAIALLGEISSVSSFRALALYDRGLAQARLGRLGDARDSLAEAAAVDSSHVAAPAALGRIHERLGDPRAAALAFESAEKRASGPTRAPFALRAGKLHEQAGSLDEALAAYGRAAVAVHAMHPGVVSALATGTADPCGHSDAARVLLRLGRAAEAAQELEKALDARDDAELRFKLGLAHFLAGKPYDDEVSRLEKARPDLARRLVEIATRKRDVR